MIDLDCKDCDYQNGIQCEDCQSAMYDKLADEFIQDKFEGNHEHRSKLSH